MPFLKFNLIDRRGASKHQGEVLIIPSEIESIRSFIHTDHRLSHHEIGSVMTMKTGDRHYVSQHIAEVADMLCRVEAAV